ncbi:MAG: hypothetical protein CXZ00_11970 [Acidobacteria bacterium]|nr:MAG: hypothetical protein CXZ00_11970 [Acidobacteriota bacterium]
MGGWGSGRSSGSKDTTSDYRRLDVRQWQRGGYLAPGRVVTWQWTRNGEKVGEIGVRAESDRVILSYRHCSMGSKNWERLEYPVAIDWTPCHYGGRRAWFRCPGQGCGRRVAILYIGKYALCRHCRQLAYECQREPPHYRALNRAQAIRMKLGGSGSMVDPYPWKPKGMHWRTYHRYKRKSAAIEGRLWALEAAMLHLDLG